MGMASRKLVAGALLPLLAAATACGGGSPGFETLLQDNQGSAVDAFHYLGIATTEDEAVTVALSLGGVRPLRALTRFPADGETVLVALKIGTAVPRGDEVGYIRAVRPRDDYVEVRVGWRDDGIDDDDDQVYAPYHMVLVERSKIPESAMGSWRAIDTDGNVVAEVTYPPTWNIVDEANRFCFITIPEDLERYRDRLRLCP